MTFVSDSRAPVTFISIRCRFTLTGSRIAELRPIVLSLVVDEMPRGTHDVELTFPEVVRESGTFSGSFHLTQSLPDGIENQLAMQTITRLCQSLLTICDGKPKIRMK